MWARKRRNWFFFAVTISKLFANLSRRVKRLLQVNETVWILMFGLRLHPYKIQNSNNKGHCSLLASNGLRSPVQFLYSLVFLKTQKVEWELSIPSVRFNAERVFVRKIRRIFWDKFNNVESLDTGPTTVWKYSCNFFKNSDSLRGATTFDSTDFFFGLWGYSLSQ